MTLRDAGGRLRPSISGIISAAACATTALSLPALADPTGAAEFSMPARLAEQSLLLDVTAAGDGLIVVGERGHILRSHNDTSSWRQVIVPTRAMLTAVAFHDERLGLAVGHDAVILRTEDGGATWQKVHDAPGEQRPLLDVRFDTAGKAVAVGAYGYFLESNDGGRQWKARALQTNESSNSDIQTAAPAQEQAGDDFHLNQVSVSDNGKYYMAAEAGNVYRSDDNGTSWFRLPSPYEGSFFGVLPLEGDEILVYGMEGRVYRSQDAGDHWRRIDTGTSSALFGGTLLGDGTLVVVGFSGVVLVSVDNGNHFSLQQQTDRSGLRAVTEAGNGDLILVGEGGIRRLPRTALRVRPEP